MYHQKIPASEFANRFKSGCRWLLIVFIALNLRIDGLLGVERDTISYRGNLIVDGQSFNGTGLFKFALLDQNDKVLWGSSAMDASGIPNQASELPVSGGVYTVYLGSADQNMPPLTDSVINAFPNLTLRIWFNDGKNGFQRLEPDQNLAQAPQKMVVGESRKAAAKTAPKTKAAEAEASTRNRQSIGGSAKIFRFPDPLRFGAGSSHAKIVLIEYSDYECGHCRMFHEITFPKIKEEYVDTGLIYFLSGNFPLNNHRHSQKAAEASYCAGDQGQYWAMRDLLFENNMNLGADTFRSLATELGLDLEQFRACLESSVYTGEIQKEKMIAKSLGIRQTPSFILGHPGETGDVEGELLAGSRYWTEFKRQINLLLEQP